MTALDERERNWLQRALNDEEYQRALELPVDLTRSLYSDIFLYGPQAEQVLLGVELFAEETDTHFDSHERFRLKQCANHVYGVFASSMNKDPFMISYLGRLSTLSETHDAYNRMVFLGALCCLVGEGVYEKQSVLEAFREDNRMVTRALSLARDNYKLLSDAR